MPIELLIFKFLFVFFLLKTLKKNSNLNKNELIDLLIKKTNIVLKNRNYLKITMFLNKSLSSSCKTIHISLNSVSKNTYIIIVYISV